MSVWQVVPALVSDFVEDGRVAVPAERRFEGAYLTADIVGFTALAEKLAATGARGAERVAEVINPYFERLVAAIDRRGGHVHRFAGDAVLAIFPARDGDLGGATARALAAGAEVAGIVEHVADADRDLCVRVGVAAGSLWAGVVGSGARAECLVGGEPVATSGRAASRAGKTELVVPYALRLLAPQAELTRLDDTWARVRAAPEPPPAPAWSVRDADVRAFVPEGLDLEGTSGTPASDAPGRTWHAELRRVHVVFFNVLGIRFEADHVLGQAQAATEVLHGVLARLDGRASQYLVDDSGLTLLAAWGLGGNTHEDGASRALRAGLEAREGLSAHGLPCRVGIATGTALVGLRGGRTRYEPGIFGRIVNLAARLMQSHGSAAGVACDAATAEGTRGFEIDVEAPIAVKGFAEPVAVHRVRARLARSVPEVAARALGTQHGTSLGREAEHAAIESLLDASATEAHALVVAGEAGAGKSLLLSEMVRAAEARGFTVRVGSGEASETNTPFYAWRPIFRALFADLPDADVAHALRTRLPDEHARQRIPLLAPVLPIPTADNEVTSQLSGQPRADATRRIMRDLLATSAGPQLIVLDDVHWIDSASRALALFVARELDRGLVALGTRPATTAEADLKALLGRPRTRQIVLPPLGREAITRIVTETLGAGETQSKLLDLVFERSGGNPFFASQIALGLRESGRIALRDGRAVLVESSGPELALDSIQSVLVARIDRAPAASQRLLKAAAVIGQLFDQATLVAAWPDAGLGPALASLVEAGLVVDAGASLAFGHPLMREAAYGLLTFAQRRELHARVAGHIEAQAGDDDRRAAIVSHHLVHAEEHARALPFLERAGAHAARAFASEEVVTFFTRAREVADRGGVTPEPLRAARWERAVGEARLKLLDYDASERHLHRALALLGQASPRTAAQRVGALLLALVVQTWHRYFPRRMRARDAELRLEAADLIELENEIAWYRNDALGLLCGSFRQLNLAEDAHDVSAQLVQAYATVSIPTSLVGMHGLARAYADRSAAGVDALASLSARGYALLTQSVYHQAYGRWEEVETHVSRARQIFSDLGDRHRHQQTLAIETVLNLHRGTHARALELAGALERTVGPDDPPQFLSWTTATRALGAMVDGSLALGLLDELDALSRRKLEGGELMLVLGVLSSALEYAGEHARAEEAATRALAHADTLMPSTYYGLRGYAGLVDAWTRQLARAQKRGDADARAIERSSTRALKHLRAFARAFPIGAPALRAHSARLELARGRGAAAKTGLGVALEAAERLRIPWDGAMAAFAIDAPEGDASEATRREALRTALGASERFVAWCRVGA